MDQIKIGRFIAAARKEQKMTQRQLADALSISDKTVSKWECGKGLPKVSLMLPLCDALHITVNELLTSEKVLEVDYQKRAEDNIMDLMNENEKIVREIYVRGWLTVILGMIVWMGAIYASKIMADNGLYGVPQMVTAGMSGFIGIIIANGFTSIMKGKKLLK